MKQQVILIHGGDTFDTYEEYLAFIENFEIDFDRYRTSKKDWKGNLQENLGEGFEVIAPAMPNKTNAKYAEWKIWFEKFIPHFDERVVLVGHSLGGTFLAKYLAENDVSKEILATFLVAACYDAADADYPMADFNLPESLERLEQQGGKLFLYHSEDDPVVPFSDFRKYQSALGKATFRTFSDRGHFNQEAFPELIADIEGVV